MEKTYTEQQIHDAFRLWGKDRLDHPENFRSHEECDADGIVERTKADANTLISYLGQAA